MGVYTHFDICRLVEDREMLLLSPMSDFLMSPSSLRSCLALFVFKLGCLHCLPYSARSGEGAVPREIHSLGQYHGFHGSDTSI